MDKAGFISSWSIPISGNQSRLRFKSRCDAYPKMNLISHEKGEVLFNSGDTEVAKYKLEIEIPAAYSKDKRRKSIAALKKNATYKGFRKGTVPPFIMKEVPAFVLRDSVTELVQSALKELNLEPNEGEASEPDVDFDEMLKRFQVGEDFTFSCEMALKNAAEEQESNEENLVAADVDAKQVE